MTVRSDWRSAFPLRSAEDAVDALLDAWNRLVAEPPPGISSKTHEPKLTKQLKFSLENYLKREHGLLGSWVAEDVIGQLDPVTGELVEERRTDIAYCWNNETQSLKLVFEFKRLAKHQYRDKYLGKHGLARFVSGIYAREQPVAAMVGILLDSAADVVSGIQSALADKSLATELRLRNNHNTGLPYTQPSALFAQAAFDTEHDRDPPLAPPHGYIQVAHFFVSF